MGKFIDLTGNVFGKLTVLELAQKDHRGLLMWLCHCECGTKQLCLGIKLTTWRKTSCGTCTRTTFKSIPLGTKFRKWTVIGSFKKFERPSKPYYKWLCRCDCGTERYVCGSQLRRKKSTSCGCDQADLVSTHKMSYTRLYKTWKRLKDRCSEEWKNFDTFHRDVKTIPKDRYVVRTNHDIPYSKENFRLSPFPDKPTRFQYLSFKGEKLRAHLWCEKLGITLDTLRARIRANWPPEKVFMEISDYENTDIKIGMKFGMMTISSVSDIHKNKRPIYCTIRCECGKRRKIRAKLLTGSPQISCGCLRFKDETGNRFNKLVVLKRVANDELGNARWLCRCDCGQEKEIYGSSLRSNHTKSCGCLQIEYQNSRTKKSLVSAHQP